MPIKNGLGQVSDTDIRTLRIFKTVAECGGFSAAEVALNISRAAISVAISDLETRVGFVLCQRGRAGFALTTEGRQIFEHTLQLLASIDQFRTNVNAMHDHLKGELNIGITDNLVTIPHMRVTRALARLKDLGPDIRVNIRMLPPTVVEQHILDGQLHVGIVPDLRPISGLRYDPLYQEQSLLYCSQAHPLFNLDETSLAKMDFKTMEAVVPAYSQTDDIRAHHLALNATATATDREGIAFLIRTGKYIGYLPDHLAAQWVNQGEFKALLPHQHTYTTTFFAITRSASAVNTIRDAFMEQLK